MQTYINLLKTGQIKRQVEVPFPFWWKVVTKICSGECCYCPIIFDLLVASEELLAKTWVPLSDLAHVRISFNKHRFVFSASVDFHYRCHVFIKHSYSYIDSLFQLFCYLGSDKFETGARMLNICLLVVPFLHSLTGKYSKQSSQRYFKTEMLYTITANTWEPTQVRGFY